MGKIARGFAGFYEVIDHLEEETGNCDCLFAVEARADIGKGQTVPEFNSQFNT